MELAGECLITVSPFPLSGWLAIAITLSQLPSESTASLIFYPFSISYYGFSNLHPPLSPLSPLSFARQNESFSSFFLSTFGNVEELKMGETSDPP